MIGVDLAKNIFQLHIASMCGQVLSWNKLSREKFRSFMQQHDPAVVVIEACGSVHFWTETLGEMGHQEKLIASQYVKPFVKRQKNDAADAEAIVIAAQRPEMRFVELKSKAQRAKAVLFCGRDRLVHQRTEQINVLRSVRYAYGYVIPQEFMYIRHAEEILNDPTCDRPDIVKDECRDLLAPITENTNRISIKTRVIN